jgi:hypothetical protein
LAAANKKNHHPNEQREVSLPATRIVVHLSSVGMIIARTPAISGSRPRTFYLDRFYRESAASLGSACSGFHSRLCHTAASRFPWTTANTSRRSACTR